MALLTTREELALVREALQALAGGTGVYERAFGDMRVKYGQADMDKLQSREQTLLRHLTIRNVRKRTTPDFTG